MPILKSSIDTNSKEFAANRAHMEKLAAELREQQAKAALGGDEKARKKHTDRGKLLPRERIEALLDRGSPFLELSPLAAHGMYDGDAPCAGVITGIGRVHGREVVVVANDATVKGGTYYPITVKRKIGTKGKTFRQEPPVRRYRSAPP